MGNAWIWGWSNGFKIKELACTYNKNGYTYVTKFQLFMTQGVILRSEVPSSRAGYWRTRGCKLYYVPGSLLLEQNLCLSNTLKSRRLGKLGKYDPVPPPGRPTQMLRDEIFTKAFVQVPNQGASLLTFPWDIS